MYNINNHNLTIKSNIYRYLALTKPKIIVLLSLTGIVSYLLPGLNNIRFVDVIVFLYIGFASSGGAMAINNYIDRDIDILMIRTSKRGSVGDNAINPNKILLFSIGLLVSGLIIALLYFSIYAVLYLAWGSLFYIFGYSLYLKRKSMLNTILGGLASPAPVLTGFAARYEQLGMKAEFLGVPYHGLLIGLIIFVWTPSHTWALSSKYLDDYSRADIPMLPVKLGIQKTSKITLYSGLITIFYSLWVFYTILNSFTRVFIVLIILDIFFFISLFKFYRRADKETANRCFKTHNLWLALIFICIILFKVI